MAISQASEIDNASVMEADVCVVGAGAAGLALATDLLLSGLKVVVLESGRMTPDRQAQKLSGGEIVGLRGFPLGQSQVRGLGGSTRRWGGQCTRLSPVDFEACDGDPHHRWPIGFDDLTAWYDKAEAFCCLGEDPGPLLDMHGPALGDDLEVAQYRFAWPTDLCSVHSAPVLRSDTVHVLLGATCTEIVTDPRGQRVEALAVSRADGSDFQVRPRAVVLAAGGIENARLMLASTSCHPDGVGNRHDVVGRYYMDHPYLMTGYLNPASEAAARGPYVIQSFRRAGWEQRGHTGFALSQDLRRREGLRGCAAYFINRLASETHADHFSGASRAWSDIKDACRYGTLDATALRDGCATMACKPLPLARTIARRAREVVSPRRRLAMRTVLDTTPRRDSRMTLGDARDRLGQLRPRLDWRVNPEDRRALDRLVNLLSARFSEAGLGTLVTDPARDALGWPVSFEGGRHHIGTTRMHADPKRGVIDANCRVHGMENLYVSGSSVFTTPGYANPTLTIVALALRLADHLRGQSSG